jgi:phosphocarrier protein HPr
MPERVEPDPARPADQPAPEDRKTLGEPNAPGDQNVLADQNGLGDQNAPGDQNALADRNALGDPNAPGDQQAIIVSRAVTIPNRRGLHARAAAKFVTMAERFDASVDVIRDGQSVSARSIMGLMMLGAGCGATIELRAEGWGAKEALDALAALVEAGFEEHD